MATVRIYKVAELLNTSSQEVIALLKRDHGIEVKSASSTIEEVVARQFVERLARQRNIIGAAERVVCRHAGRGQGQEAGRQGRRAAEAGRARAAAAASGQECEAGGAAAGGRTGSCPAAAEVRAGPAASQPNPSCARRGTRACRGTGRGRASARSRARAVGADDGRDRVDCRAGAGSRPRQPPCRARRPRPASRRRGTAAPGACRRRPVASCRRRFACASRIRGPGRPRRRRRGDRCLVRPPRAAAAAPQAADRKPQPARRRPARIAGARPGAAAGRRSGRRRCRRAPARWAARVRCRRSPSVRAARPPRPGHACATGRRCAIGPAPAPGQHRPARQRAACRRRRQRRRAAAGHAHDHACRRHDRRDLADKLDVKAKDVLKKLIDRRLMMTINSTLDDETASMIAREFGADVKMQYASKKRCCRSRRKTSTRADLVHARAGRHRHGPRRPRQDDAARRDPLGARRRARSRRHHAAHRRVLGHRSTIATSCSSTRRATKRSR